MLRDPTGIIQCVSHSADKNFEEVNKITRESSVDLIFIIAVILGLLSHKCLSSIHEFFSENGFYEIQAPSFVGGSVEGGATLFEGVSLPSQSRLLIKEEAE